MGTFGHLCGTAARFILKCAPRDGDAAVACCCGSGSKGMPSKRYAQLAKAGAAGRTVALAARASAQPSPPAPEVFLSPSNPSPVRPRPLTAPLAFIAKPTSRRDSLGHGRHAYEPIGRGANEKAKLEVERKRAAAQQEAAWRRVHGDF